VTSRDHQSLSVSATGAAQVRAARARIGWERWERERKRSRAWEWKWAWAWARASLLSFSSLLLQCGRVEGKSRTTPATCRRITCPPHRPRTSTVTVGVRGRPIARRGGCSPLGFASVPVSLAKIPLSEPALRLYLALIRKQRGDRFVWPDLQRILDGLPANTNDGTSDHQGLSSWTVGVLRPWAMAAGHSSTLQSKRWPTTASHLRTSR
jgi:hypothetical protein